MNIRAVATNYYISTVKLQFSAKSSAIYAGANIYGWDGSNEITFSGINTSKVLSMQCSYDNAGNAEVNIEAYSGATIGDTIRIYAGGVKICECEVVSVEVVNDRLYRIRAVKR